VAGLRAAVELAPAGQVLVLAKDKPNESSSQYAQGGIAAAISDDDEVALHEQDTLFAGDGLCDPDAVRLLVREGPRVIEELIGWGAAFDRDGPKLSFGREGAHSRNRILHAQGDSTGREILRSLWQKATSSPSVRVLSFTAITELLESDGVIAGALAYDAWTGESVEISARAVLLATGGLGRVYSATTNPDVATGDGIGLAYRAGAEVSDIEFIQFHPTALHLPDAPCFLLSEALRGEGAYLLNPRGERFMHRYHPLAELAPRDVVSRAMVLEMLRTGERSISLDLTHLPPARVRKFPRIYETCLRYGIDMCTQPAPVHPAAHYAMGGVRTDLFGRTTVDRLFAAGEVACTGVHGANRLASNSLLEGLVFGARAGSAMLDLATARRLMPERVRPTLFPSIAETELRALAWEHAGIVRDAAGLGKLLRHLQDVPWLPHPANATRVECEVRNMHLVATLIARCALAREESRGAHTRSDFPSRRPEFQKHSVARKGNFEVLFRDLSGAPLAGAARK
jgi:L-aspartate oxidase